MGRFKFHFYFKKKDNRDDSFEYTPEEKKVIGKAKEYTGAIFFSRPSVSQKAYIPNEDKKECNIEFNETLPESVKEKFRLFCEKKGIHDMKGWNQLIKKEGQKITDELVDEVKNDPEFVKWSVEAYFKDTLELCIRNNDGSLKNWIIDEALKQSILDE